MANGSTRTPAQSRGHEPGDGCVLARCRSWAPRDAPAIEAAAAAMPAWGEDGQGTRRNPASLADLMLANVDILPC